MPLTPEQRTQRARLAALARWAKHDPKQHMAKARDGILEKYRREVLAENPDTVEPELTRRADCLWRLHMSRMAFQSSKARSKPDEGEAVA